MIITVWEIYEERYFTLTFTSTDSSQNSLPSTQGQTRKVVGTNKLHSLRSIGSSNSRSSASSVSSGHSSNHGGSSNSSAITNPTNASMSTSPFPPLGPPARRSGLLNAPSSLQKVIMMKDALLDSIETAIPAMWKDESLTIPNKAARRLFHPGAELTSVKDGYDLVSKWHVWDETFTIRMDPSEHPISHLVRTQSPFSSRKIGIHDPETGRRIFLDCLFEAIR